MLVSTCITIDLLKKIIHGITLIALVVTIVVLLILAGVAINLVFNQENLFNRANEAASKWNTAQQKEQNELNNIIHELQSLFKTEVTDNVLMEKSPSTWTDGDVSITLIYNNIPAGYVIEYKIGEGEWTEGTSVIVKENNTTVYARLYNKSIDHETGTNSTTVTTIDREAPTAPTKIESSATINSITVTASGGTDSVSGVAGYQYSIDNINWTETIEEGKSYTYSEIKANTEVTIYARTIDYLQKTSSTYQIEARTTGAESNVTLTRSVAETTWTNGDVTVTLSYSNIPSGYVLQYKIGSGNWTTGTSVTVTTNNTTVYGRLYNATIDDEIAANSVTIGNIDKIDPTAPTSITSSVTTNSITVKASGGTDVGSGVAGYQYRINSGEWSATISNGSSHTFSGLTAATNYTIEARTVDKVGRTSSVYTKTIQSGSIKVTGITLANKTLTKTGTTNPTVTITPTITPSNATNKGVTWNSSNPAVATVNASGVVTYVGAGTTTITATAQDGSGVRGTCTVTCNWNDTNSYTINGGGGASRGETKEINLDLTGANTLTFTLSWAGSPDYDLNFELKQGTTIIIRKIEQLLERGWTREFTNTYGGSPATVTIDVSAYSGPAILSMYCWGYVGDGDWCTMTISNIQLK